MIHKIFLLNNHFFTIKENDCLKKYFQNTNRYLMHKQLGLVHTALEQFLLLTSSEEDLISEETDKDDKMFLL